MRDSVEKQLVERIRAGDQSAVGELSAAYGSRIFQLAFRYTRNREDAEEVAQDVLLKVCRGIDAFRGESALSSWIYRITFNTAMSRLRTTRSRALEVAGPVTLTIPTPTAAPRFRMRWPTGLRWPTTRSCEAS